jgi:hypothetical protein
MLVPRALESGLESEKAGKYMGKHGHQHHGAHDSGAGHESAPYWKRVHHSWIFWVGAVLTFSAIVIYVMSMDLSWRPRIRATRTQTSDAAGR